MRAHPVRNKQLSKVIKIAAVELWKVGGVPLQHQGTAQHTWDNSEQGADLCQEVAEEPWNEQGRLQVAQEPGEEHAQEVQGCH